MLFVFQYVGVCIGKGGIWPGRYSSTRFRIRGRLFFFSLQLVSLLKDFVRISLL